MIAFSRFPARVVTSDGRTLRKTAVVVDGGRARVAEKAGDVKVVLDRSDVVRVERLISRATEIEFADGTVWTVSKGDGCSCGSPLKTWYAAQLAAAA